MTSEECRELEAHLQGLARILYKNTPPEQLKDVESIELALRGHMLETIGPQLGNF
ncbi:MAG: hypothetical protein GDA48_10925 [Hormoscilla sp. GM102CHS1]|nr:hypothetical protein [Hormoscilla sp. GM102CHS1]MBC6472957.1 hypothetical protein [Hormoscilla sp. GM102CHS1]MBC6473072.1 hypothetical protein [Hormoscilla sp. GM102CHS1]MBC6473198.1 hypothetical protein [Hormoscilla sp. GM102CHS1]MBC6473256.1 hypothetical protein [Hormoscilla sp. GM102CHS1]